MGQDVSVVPADLIARRFIHVDLLERTQPGPIWPRYRLRRAAFSATRAFTISLTKSAGVGSPV